MRLLLGMLLAALLGGTAAADTLVRVGIAQPEFSLIPLDVGIAEGMFARRQLAIEKLVFSGAAKVHQAIAAGSVDIALSGGPQMSFIVKGAPELAVAALADRPADLALVTLRDGTIRSFDDLRGKRISVSTTGSLSEWAGRAFARQQGWGAQGVVLVPLGSFTAQTAALKTHQVDAMLAESSTAGRLEEEGSGRTLMNFGHVVDDFHIHVVFAANDFMRQHPDELRLFLAGMFEAIRFMRDHRDATVGVAARTLGISSGLAGNLYDELIPYYNETGRFRPKALAVVAQAMVEMGALDVAPDMQALLTERFLPAAP